MVRLADLLREPLRNGHSAKASTDGTGVPTLTLTAVTYGSFAPENIKRTVADPSKVEDLWLEPGDLLIERANTPELVGTTRLFPGPSRLAIFPDLVIRARVNVGVSGRFIEGFMQSQSARSYFQRRAQGIAGSMPKIDQTAIEQLVVALAPAPEQPRIADQIDSYLSRLDAAVASLERAQAKLKAYRASVLKSAVEGRLVPTEAELARKEKRTYEPASELLARLLVERRRRWEEAELAKLNAAGKPPKDEKWKDRYPEPSPPETNSLPGLPEGWSWASADQVGDILLGRQRSPAYLTGKWTRPYLRVANIKDDRIEFDDVEEMDFDDVHFPKYQLKSGDILVSEGQSPHLVGQSAIYHGGVEGLCFQKTLHRFRPLNGAPSGAFSQIVFRSNVMLGVFKKAAAITTNIAHLTLEKFQASRFPLPPTAEQERIVLEVERLLSVSEMAEKQIRIDRLRIARLRQAVLKWAFEGKLVDQDPKDEPAADLLARLRAERAAANDTKATRGPKKKAAK